MQSIITTIFAFVLIIGGAVVGSFTMGSPVGLAIVLIGIGILGIQALAEEWPFRK